MNDELKTQDLNERSGHGMERLRNGDSDSSPSVLRSSFIQWDAMDAMDAMDTMDTMDTMDGMDAFSIQHSAFSISSSGASFIVHHSSFITSPRTSPRIALDFGQCFAYHIVTTV